MILRDLGVISYPYLLLFYRVLVLLDALIGVCMGCVNAFRPLCLQLLTRALLARFRVTNPSALAPEPPASTTRFRGYFVDRYTLPCIATNTLGHGSRPLTAVH